MEFTVTHRKEIAELKEYTTKEAYKILASNRYDLLSVMTPATFKAYRAAAEAFVKVEEESENEIEEMYQDKIDKLRQEIVILKKEKEGAQNIDGWTVRKVGDYFRIYKSIKGKVHSIHLGRKIDIEKAKLKIQEKWKRIYENDPTLRPCT